MTSDPSQAKRTCPQCGKLLKKKNPVACPRCKLPVLLVAGKYRLRKVLDEGNMGFVYLAEHIHLDTDVERVIKAMKPQVLSRSGMVERFFREVRVTAALHKLSKHVVQIYDDFGEQEGIGYYYVMEYLRGRSLKKMQKPGQTVEVELALHIMEQLCRAMKAAHDEGVVHRDLKPENIILVPERGDPYFVKVIDFGIAKPLRRAVHMDLTQGAIGTPDYMAPEQCLNLKVDNRADIYAMGVVLYEMLTGTTPFAPLGKDVLVTMHAQVSEIPESMRERRPDLGIPKGFDDVVMRAMEKNPADRFSSVEEFWEALTRFWPTELNKEYIIDIAKSRGTVEMDRVIGPKELRKAFEERKARGREATEQQISSLQVDVPAEQAQPPGVFESMLEDAQKRSREKALEELSESYQDAAADAFQDAAMNAFQTPVSSHAWSGEPPATRQDVRSPRRQSDYDDVAETSQRHYSDVAETSQRHYSDVAETSQRRYDDVAETSQRHYSDVAETSQRRYDDVAETSQRRYDDVAETSQRRYDDVAETSQRRYDDVAETSQRRIPPALWDEEQDEGPGTQRVINPFHAPVEDQTDIGTDERPARYSRGQHAAVPVHDKLAAGGEQHQANPAKSTYLSHTQEAYPMTVEDKGNHEEPLLLEHRKQTPPPAGTQDVLVLEEAKTRSRPSPKRKGAFSQRNATQKMEIAPGLSQGRTGGTLDLTEDDLLLEASPGTQKVKIGPGLNQGRTGGTLDLTEDDLLPLSDNDAEDTPPLGRRSPAGRGRRSHGVQVLGEQELRRVPKGHVEHEDFLVNTLLDVDDDDDPQTLRQRTPSTLLDPHDDLIPEEVRTVIEKTPTLEPLEEAISSSMVVSNPRDLDLDEDSFSRLLGPDDQISKKTIPLAVAAVAERRRRARKTEGYASQGPRSSDSLSLGDALLTLDEEMTPKAVTPPPPPQSAYHSAPESSMASQMMATMDDNVEGMPALVSAAVGQGAEQGWSMGGPEVAQSTPYQQAPKQADPPVFSPPTRPQNGTASAHSSTPPRASISDSWRMRDEKPSNALIDTLDVRKDRAKAKEQDASNKRHLLLYLVYVFTVFALVGGGVFWGGSQVGLWGEGAKNLPPVPSKKGAVAASQPTKLALPLPHTVARAPLQRTLGASSPIPRKVVLPRPRRARATPRRARRRRRRRRRRRHRRRRRRLLAKRLACGRLYHKKQLTRALRCYRRLVRRDRRNAYAYVLMGLLNARIGHCDKAGHRSFRRAFCVQSNRHFRRYLRMRPRGLMASKARRLLRRNKQALRAHASGRVPARRRPPTRRSSDGVDSLKSILLSPPERRR